VGETMRDMLRAPFEALRARDLRDPALLARKVLRQQEAKREELRDEIRSLPENALAARECVALSDPRVMGEWAARASSLAGLGVVRSDETLHDLLVGDEPVVFEGAQGVLLDEWVGFHPFTTWSTCTWQNAEELLHEHGSPHPAFRLGVLRTYATRHGAGPFPTEARDLPPTRTVEHNSEGPWQGAFRSGWFDAVLARYALLAAGGAEGLALTHLDRVPKGRPWPMATAYDVGGDPDPELFERSDDGHVRNLRLGPPHDLAHVEALGRALLSARPTYKAIQPGSPSVAPDVSSAVEEELGVRVMLTSFGPTASDKAMKE
jgi:adenylosuccinate synthase